MALVAAKCTECGAAIQVEDTKDAGICNFCGTAFVTQKVINEHHTHITKHVTKNVFGQKGKSADDYCDNGETFLKLGDWDKAIEAFEQATTLEPSNYLGWLGLFKSYTENFTDLDDTEHEEYYRRALAVANDDEKKIIKTLCDEFIRKSKTHREKQEKLEQSRQVEIEAATKEKQIIFNKLRKRTNLFFALSMPLIVMAILGLAMSFMFWQLLVPIGATCLALAIIFIVLCYKTSVKRDKVKREMQELNPENVFSTVFKDIFN